MECACGPSPIPDCGPSSIPGLQAKAVGGAGDAGTGDGDWLSRRPSASEGAPWAGGPKSASALKRLPLLLSPLLLPPLLCCSSRTLVGVSGAVVAWAVGGQGTHPQFQI